MCENNCKFIGYDNDTKEVSCECDPQNIFSIFDININSDVLLKKFFKLSETFNFEVLLCHRFVFTKKGLIKNLGNYIFHKKQMDKYYFLKNNLFCILTKYHFQK